PEEQPAEEAVPAEEPLPEEATPAEEPLAEELSEPAIPAESVAEPVEEEAPPPFQASLIVEKGRSQGTAFALAHIENRVGGSGAQIELGEDPYVAPHAATLVFAEDHLAVRDEGTANGVFVKVRESAPLESCDFFVAGERLFRYDGPTELARNGEGDTPFLGAPRPQGNAVRVTEMLAGGKTGRTCHRAGPSITIGRTGCDMNFPADALLAPKHAEIRLAEDGSATLVDLGAGPSGVLVRVRAQGQHDLHAGDLLQIGDQLLRVEVG
ncbi:MAG: FHA domain-containing protein, partial [Myxococcales bacterium]